MSFKTINNQSTRSLNVSRIDPRRHNEPKDDIKQLMSSSPVVLLGNVADDIIFHNTMSCAALKKGVPGGLDRINPSTVHRQREAEVGPYTRQIRKKPT
jgi:hypothetical protein